MADYLVYWRIFWRENPNGLYTPNFLWHTAQGFGENVAAENSLWVVARGGRRFPGEWRLVERIVVQEKFPGPDPQWPNGFRGDPTRSEAYQISNQADFTPLLHQLQFNPENPIVAEGGAIGNHLQAARRLTGADISMLVDYARGLEPIAISAASLNRLIGVSDEDLSTRLSPTGAGFGDPETNRKVERAAVSVVTDWYQSEGWNVKSVEAEKCGYDLLCQKGSDEKHVEVKGVQGGLVAFIITANEERQAKNDPDFVLCVVTSALTAPKLNFYGGTIFATHFHLAPLAYRAILRTKPR